MKEREIKKAYLEGKKYKEIIEKYKISEQELRRVIRKNKLTRTKREAQKGNKNAVGNKGGGAAEKNKNAVRTGEYESIYKDVLEEEEKEIYRTLRVENKEELLKNDYKILTIREKRMLERIKKLKEQNKEMTIDRIRKKREGERETETTIESEPTIKMIQRIEEGLTRVEESKRKVIESLIKINSEIGNKDIKENINSATDLLESINKQLGGGKSGNKREISPIRKIY